MDIKVNFKIKVSDFLSYEFETLGEYVFIEEAELSCNLFRLFINSDGTNEIFVANSEDYDIHEDVTHLFDVKDILIKCTQEDNKGNVRNETEGFRRDMLERYGRKY